MRRGGVELAQEVPERAEARRPWILLLALVLVAAGVGYGVYRATTVTLEETPPLRPLEPAELAAYLERDQVQVGTYQSLMMLSGGVEGWPESAADIASKMQGESARWSLERPLTRDLLGADQTFAAMETQQERVK
ncbi:MAG: hypothetical protein WCB63_07265, partial [Polyangiales bacterium]